MVPYQPEMNTNAARESDILTVSQAARMLGIHPNTLRTWSGQGVLPCVRINRRGDRRYRRDDLATFIGAAGQEKTVLTDRLLERTAQACAAASDVNDAIQRVADVVCSSGVFRSAAWATVDGVRPLVGTLRGDSTLFNRATTARRPIVRVTTRADTPSAAVPVLSVSSASGVLLLSGRLNASNDEQHLLSSISNQLAMVAQLDRRRADVDKRNDHAGLVLALSAELGRQLDPNVVLVELVNRSAALFGADHAGVFTRSTSGGFEAQATLNLSSEYSEALERATDLPIVASAFEQRQIVTIKNYADDPRSVSTRTELIHEGINTVTVAPLLSDTEPLGVLALYHDAPYEWAPLDLALLERLAEQGSTIVRNAQNYSRMATWAAQLHSIQQLGTRLTRLRTVDGIGQTICTELNQLIACHNIRVYRIEGSECVPVAWRGEVGEYESEDGERLRLGVGEGITGWVARHGVAQNIGNAAADARAKTIPGTKDDLDESLLLAPMLFDDEVIGVIVLAKLGLDQFGPDDLRVLEIYASIAAQAVANADATERLRAQSEALGRQLDSQRELLRVTESILTTLDTQALLEEIAERLQSLIHVDNLAVALHDAPAHKLRTIYARGVDAAAYLSADSADDQGVSAHVLTTGEAELVPNDLAAPHVSSIGDVGPLPGALIVAPLRSGEGIQGLLTIERIGEDASFTSEEFDLVKLFAGHVSIALRNAAAHRAVELRAETDRLTGLWNHGALMEQIERLVDQRTRFGMLMVDLDFFKRYNDEYGHQAGNVMLQHVAQVLRDCSRESDLVFRFGGDEFAVLLPNTGLSGARTVAEKLHQAITGVDDGVRSTVPITCSVGIAVYPKDGHDATSVIIAADRACYAGKRAGRNRIATAVEGLALATEFRPTEPTTPIVLQPAYPAA